MGKIYRFLGLSVGLIVNGMDNEARRRAYNCDITYGTNNEPVSYTHLEQHPVAAGALPSCLLQQPPVRPGAAQPHGTDGGRRSLQRLLGRSRQKGAGDGGEHAAGAGDPGHQGVAAADGKGPRPVAHKVHLAGDRHHRLRAASEGPDLGRPRCV